VAAAFAAYERARGATRVNPTEALVYDIVLCNGVAMTSLTCAEPAPPAVTRMDFENASVNTAEPERRHVD
jgi:hypothetical protein